MVFRFDAARICAVALIVVSLTVIHQFIAPLRLIRPSLTVLMLFWGIAVLSPSKVRWKNLTAAWPPKVVGVLFAISLASIAFGISAGGALQYFLDHYVKVLVFFAALMISMRRVEDFALLSWTFVISIGILTILSVTVMDVRSTRSGLDRIAGQGMFDANDIGMVILMGMPVARLVQQSAGRLGRWVAGAVLFTSPITIALTGSRGALIGFLIVGPMMVMALTKISFVKRVSILGTMAVVLVFAAPAGYWAQMETTFNAEEDYNYSSDYGRIPIAKRGLFYMSQYPLFGLGVRNFPRAEGTISPIAADREAMGLSLMWVSPHNTFVQVGAELGIPALILWIGMHFAGMFGLWRLRKRMPKSWERGTPQQRFLRDACQMLPVSWAGFGATSFFLTHAYTTPVYILLALTGGAIVFTRLELAKERAAALAAGTPAMQAPRALPAGRRRARFA